MEDIWRNIESWVSFSKDVEAESNLENTSELKEKIDTEKKTIVYFSYLTTLSRLWWNRDLSNLFDGDIDLWEEELLSIYSLIEIINGANSFEKLMPPKTMEMDIDWWQDYSYELDYETLDHQGGIKRVKSLQWDGSLPMNETKLVFNYQWAQLDSLDFERSFNPDEVWLDQKISIIREWDLATKLRVYRDFDLDNEVLIQYNSINKPEVIEQTQLWVLSDKMVFEYTETWELLSIIYVPALSLKHLKWAVNTFKKWKQVWWLLKWVQMAGEYVAFNTLKKLKWVDVVTIENQNWLPISSKSSLKASNWIYSEWFSQFDYNTKWELQKLHIEMEDFWPDDIKTLNLQYK